MGKESHNESPDVTSNKVASIIPFRDLEPSWHVSSAKIPGFMRWLISWVGGPAGYVNPSLGRAVTGENIGVGYMYLPIGQQQEGLHYHSITEIYIILKGHVQSYDSDGGRPHGVRNCGFEDVELVWLHDGIEAKGVTVYCNTQEELDRAPSRDPILTVSLKDLDPSWAAPRAKEPEFLRWSVNWVGGDKGFLDLNPGVSVVSDKLALGMTTVLPGHKQVPHSHETAEVYVVVGGKGIVNLGKGNQEVGYLDGLYFPPGTPHCLRNHGSEPLLIVWALERPERKGAVKYYDACGNVLVQTNGTH
ncbi:hypothetical protein Z517_09604 [Fonsecaea pedrosoi CBS 271.37]|uniref:Cupin type-2 domain-containing protein n=1 Tax=Fonsecaea pedrosoi CBS 271.37 TaxID=1442368 RepID=A0A0D2G8X5_9EURO|nr:uncharacterized protein Z517_09604 [Fonsecaea pedrosoi CBS 271.37]KIW77158.1 hypothetical protein Z517_09604 [Fonsecaea pedrosoi CBS 271.37]